MIYYTKNGYTKMTKVPNIIHHERTGFSTTLHQKRLVPTLGNKEICESIKHKWTYIMNVTYTMILLIKEPSGKPIAQLNLKEVI